MIRVLIVVMCVAIVLGFTVYRASRGCNSYPIGKWLNLSGVEGLRPDCRKFLGIFPDPTHKERGEDQKYTLPASLGNADIERIRDTWAVEVEAHGFVQQGKYPPYEVVRTISGIFRGPNETGVLLSFRRDIDQTWLVLVSTPNPSRLR